MRVQACHETGIDSCTAPTLADPLGRSTSDNIDSPTWDVETRTLFGRIGGLVTSLGLEADAFYQVIKQVGNYGEIYQRNLGTRGSTREGTLNALHTDGGLMYSPPVG